jgi:hypothetical protein
MDASLPEADTTSSKSTKIRSSANEAWAGHSEE